MYELIDTVATALADASKEGALDLNNAKERRRAVRWALSVVGVVDPEVLVGAAPYISEVVPAKYQTDEVLFGDAVVELVLPQVVARLGMN